MIWDRIASNASSGTWAFGHEGTAEDASCYFASALFQTARKKAEDVLTGTKVVFNKTRQIYNMAALSSFHSNIFKL